MDDILSGPITLERHLEDGVHDFLGASFCNDPATPFRGDAFVVANTARTGPHMGRWTRPDLVLVALQQLTLSRRVDVELFSFEIKREETGDITAVFEAVAHTRFAHYAYVVWHFPEASTRWRASEEIRTACQSHGIGLIVFSDPSLSSTYRTIIPPMRKAPHPYDVDNFLSKSMQDNDRKQLVEKLQTLEGQLVV